MLIGYVDNDISEELPGLPSRDIHPLECKASIPLPHLRDGPSLVMMMMLNVDDVDDFDVDDFDVDGDDDDNDVNDDDSDYDYHDDYLKPSLLLMIHESCHLFRSKMFTEKCANFDFFYTKNNLGCSTHKSIISGILHQNGLHWANCLSTPALCE